VIKLTDILTELEIGKVLFGDPTLFGRPNKWEDLKIPYELDTDDEKQLIHMLKKWIMEPQDAKGPELGQKLKELLPLKSKFPKVLDPSKGRKEYKGTTLYRGTLLSIRDVMNMSGTWQLNNGVDYYTVGGAVTSKAPFTWSAIGSSEKGYTSFTAMNHVASNFAASIAGEYGVMQRDRDYDRFVEKMVDSDYNGMIPAILEIPDTYPAALFNPQLSIALSSWFSEYEVLVVGDSVKVSKVNIINWEYYERAFERANIDPAQYFKGLPKTIN
jgi:hypothetical protein